MTHGHTKADVRNLRLHRAAFEKLRIEPTLRRACLDLVDHWLAREDLTSSRPYLVRWRHMLCAWPLDDIVSTVMDEVEGQALRQSSPLGPALSPRERWTVLREANRELATPTER